MRAQFAVSAVGDGLKVSAQGAECCHKHWEHWAKQPLVGKVQKQDKGLVTQKVQPHFDTPPGIHHDHNYS